MMIITGLPHKRNCFLVAVVGLFGPSWLNLLSVSAFVPVVVVPSKLIHKFSNSNSDIYRKRLAIRLFVEQSGQLRSIAKNSGGEKKGKAKEEKQDNSQGEEKWFSKITRRLKKDSDNEGEEKLVTKNQGSNEKSGSSFSIGNVFSSFGDSVNEAEVDKIEKELANKRAKDLKRGVTIGSAGDTKAAEGENSSNWISSTFKLNSSNDVDDSTKPIVIVKETKGSGQRKDNLNNKSSPLEAISKRVSGLGRSKDSESTNDTKKDSNGNNAWNTVTSAWNSVFNSDDNQWVVVAPKTDIAPGQSLPVFAAGLDLLLIASRDGKKLNCVANACSHFGTPLETGVIQKYEEDSAGVAVPSSRGKECITCPLHRTVFDIETGQVVGQWCPHPPGLGNLVGAVKSENKLATFETRIRGKNIEVRINSSLEQTK